MGMTGDLDLALDAGTTRVRVGTALFGERRRALVGERRGCGEGRAHHSRRRSVR